MLLDAHIINTLKQYIALLESDIVFFVNVKTDETSIQMMEMLEQVCSLSPRLKIEHKILERAPSFSVNKAGQNTGIVFAGIPLGHEFTSFIMAILQVSGRKPKISDEQIMQIKNLNQSLYFETYVSMSCHNCPDVVQALNIMASLNPHISHTMIDGATFQEEVKNKDIMAVPSIFLNGQLFAHGRMTLEEILNKVDDNSFENQLQQLSEKPIFDMLVIGGGPAGSAAAIYAARKGIKTGLVAQKFGGQVMDTLTIENFISVQDTQGPELVKRLEEHVKAYDVDIINLQKAVSLRKDEHIVIELENGAELKAKSLVIATGAKWRELGVPGEAKFKNKGVAYCPHCDGPLFKGKSVAVIGGGNSGVEAAIDLAGIVNHVTLIEFGADLKADAVLQKRLYGLSNVQVITNAQTLEITGDDKVNGLSYQSRIDNLVHRIELDGVFIQIGLVPNTSWLKGTVDLTRFGEIIVDAHGSTNVSGVYAAGDCTNIPYKQIIIAMGEGAKASLGAFDYLIRQ